MQVQLLNIADPAVDWLFAEQFESKPLMQYAPGVHSEQLVPLFPKYPGLHMHGKMEEEPGGESEFDGHA